MDDEDNIFECPDCNVASCRQCRVKNHSPMSCEGISHSKDKC
jgi:hypothetical protein